MIADLVVKGKVFTSKRGALTAEAFAVKDGSYVYVGNCEGVDEYIGPDTQVIETGDGLAMAGIGEGHAHVSETVSYIFEVDLAPYKVSDIPGYQDEIRKFIAKYPDRKVIHGRGFLNGVFPNGMATKEYLDEISTDLALVMTSEDGHSMWCNSKALELCHIDETTPDIKDGVVGRVEGSQEPNGGFRETAMSYLAALEPKYTKEDYKEAILYYQNMAVSYGISNVFEPMGGDNWREKVAAYEELIAEDRLKLFTRVGIYIEPHENWQDKLEQITEVRDRIHSKWLDFNAIKLFLDGVVEGHTAWIKEEYVDAPGDCCSCLWDADVLFALCETAQKNGFAIHIHAIGDAAVSLALDAFAYANEKTGITHNRNTITHIQLVSPEDFKRFADLHVVAAANPYWHYRQPYYFEELEVAYLGRQRAEKEYPMKSFVDAGAILTEASDWPVSVPCKPWRGLEYAITRQPIGDDQTPTLNPEERMDMAEMLIAMTINGAYQVGREKCCGSIEAGKRADFILTNQNVFEVEPHTLDRTKVTTYYCGGEKMELVEL